MGASRYPRRGHRIAPSTLRELLEKPIPATYLRGQDDDRLLLCDLDESSWDRFGDEACRQLAAEVVRAVGRGARVPMPIGGRRVPPIPRGLKLIDLELDARTLNCLIRAGIHERPQDLRAITIEGILRLRGFWVKCLVDLLTSLEHAIDHPETRKKLRAKSTVSVTGARGSCSYPRPAERLAPDTLREILTDPVPPDLLPDPGGRAWRLCDLDEDAWKHFGTQQITRLADLIVSRVNVSGNNRAVRRRRLPQPPQSTRLEDLRLENRTYNCLERKGFGKRPQELAKRTVGELLAIRAFGAKCLVDLLCALETLVAREGKLDEKLAAEAEALGRMPQARGIDFGDPRLGRLLRAVDTEASTVGELVDQVRRRQKAADPLRLYEQMCQLRHRVEALSRRTLEEELIEIFSPAGSPRDREIVAQYYGWDGGGGATLETLSKRYGLSRERIRQICVRAVQRTRGLFESNRPPERGWPASSEANEPGSRSPGRRLGRQPLCPLANGAHKKVFAPVLDRAVAFLTSRLPRRAGRLQAEFDRAGFSPRRLRLETVLRAAALLARPARCALVDMGDGQLAVKPEDVATAGAIERAARRLVGCYGAATVREVAAEVGSQPADARAPGRDAICEKTASRSSSRLPRRRSLIRLVTEALATLSDFEWLDEKRGWFRLGCLPQYGLPNLIEKVLSVAARIRVSRLRSAIARYRRIGRVPPPARALLEFCRRMPDVRVRGGWVIADPPPGWRQVLSGVEAGMVGVLKEHGPVMERSAFEECCTRAGINRFSFNAVIVRSPVIAQFGRSVYGLLGAKADRKTIRSLAGRKPPSASEGVLQGFGRTGDGRVYLAYRLSKAAIAGGVITVPAAVKNHVQGKFSIREPDGRSAGTLVCRNGCAWGLGPVLRGRGAAPGDHLLVLFDAADDVAQIHIGNQEAPEPVAAGRGEGIRD